MAEHARLRNMESGSDPTVGERSDQLTLDEWKLIFQLCQATKY